ncbi:MAG: hypothetical protein WCO93_11055 [bacterium]
MNKLSPISIFLFLFSTSFFLSSQAQKGTITGTGVKDEKSLRAYLDQKNSLYEKLIVRLGEEYWKYYANEPGYELKGPKNDVALFFQDPDFTGVINHWYNERQSIKDTMLAREIFVWHNLVVACGITLNEEVRTLQTRIEDSVTARMTSGIKDRWESIDSLTMKLIRLRNGYSLKAGFRDFGDASLDLSFMNAGNFYRYVAIIDSMTLEPYRKLVEEYKKQKNTEEFTRRGFYSLFMKYLLATENDQVPADSNRYFMIRTLAGIGIDFSKLPITTFIDKPLPPPVGGQGIAVRIPDDFRIVVIPELPFSSRMHEIGHGLHAMFTTVEPSVLKGYEWLLGGLTPAYGEGMADVMRRFVSNPEWMMVCKKISADSIKIWSEQAKKYFPVYMRSFLAQFMVEMELYKDPGQNLEGLENKLYKKYLLIDKPFKRMGPLTDNMIISYPVYMHNYMFAEIIAWQVHNALAKKFGRDYPFKSATGEYLKEKLYRDGEYYYWQEKLKHATGRTLDVTGFLKAKMGMAE